MQKMRQEIPKKRKEMEKGLQGGIVLLGDIVAHRVDLRSPSL